MKTKSFKRIKQCPGCSGYELIRFEADYFCQACDWDSMESDVHSGAYERRIGLLKKSTDENHSHAEVQYIENAVGSVFCENSNDEIVA